MWTEVLEQDGLWTSPYFAVTGQ